jgi:hypothetical protein
MKRYSVMVMEYGADREVELCQIDGDPAQTIAGLKTKTLMTYNGLSGRRTRIPKYSMIRVIDHQAEATEC